MSQGSVGLWHFENTEGAGGGSVIEEVRWDKNEGGFLTNYEEVAADQHNRWVDTMGECP